MSSIVLTSFYGKTNSSMVFAEELSKVTNIKNIVIENSYKSCTKTIYDVLLNEKPKLLISFGQRPKTKSTFIETQGKYTQSLKEFFPYENTNYKTNFNAKNLYNEIKSHEIDVSLSSNAGSYLCNHLYYSGLYYINTLNLDTQYIFIHVPTIKNFSSYDSLLNCFVNYISKNNALQRLV